MTRRIFNGAETGHVHAENVTVAGAVTFDTGTKRSGTRSFKCDGAAGAVASVNNTTSFAAAEIFVRGYVTVGTLPASTVPIARLRVSGSTNLASVRLTSAGKLQLFNDVAGTQVGSDSTLTVATDGTWYRIELRCLIGAGATDAIEARVAAGDGSHETLGPGTSLSLSDTSAGQWLFGWLASPGSGNKLIFVDDVDVNSSAGAVHNSWLGPGYNLLLLPASDNNRGTWTAGGGGTTNLWEAVNNLPPVGAASPGTNTSQIGCPTSSTTDNCDLNLTTYTAAGVGASDTVTAVYLVEEGANSSATGSDTVRLAGVSNPAITEETPSVDIVAGTYPTNWIRGATSIVEDPGVALGTAPVARVGKNVASTRRVNVCLLGLYVSAAPPSGTPASLTVTAAEAPAAGEAVTLDAASALTVTAATAPAAGGTVGLAGQGRMAVTAAGAPRPFASPLDLDDLLLWFDAIAQGGSDGVTANMIDQSGNGWDATDGTAGQRPTYRATGINGGPSFEFDGGDSPSTAAIDLSAYTGLSVYLVGTAASGGDKIFLEFGDINSGSGSAARWNVYRTSGNLVFSYGKGSDYNARRSVASVTTTPVVISAHFDFRLPRFVVELRVNGSSESTQQDFGLGNASALANVALDVGSRGGSSFFHAGHIGAVVVCTRRHNVAEINEVEQYLADRFGVSAYQPSLGVVVCDGASNTEGAPNSATYGAGKYPEQLRAAWADGDRYDWVIPAVSGQTMADMLNRYPSFVRPFLARDLDSIVFVCDGASNSFHGASPASQASVQTAMSDYLALAGGDGAKAIPDELLPRSDAGTGAGFDGNRATFNAWLATISSQYAALAQSAHVATIGDDGDEENTTYYYDLVHPTTAGHAERLPTLEAALDAARPQTVTLDAAANFVIAAATAPAAAAGDLVGSASEAGTLTVDPATAPAAGGGVSLNVPNALAVDAAPSPAAGGTVALPGQGALAVAPAESPAAGGTVNLTSASLLTATPATAPATADGALVVPNALAAQAATADAAGGGVGLNVPNALAVQAAESPAVGGAATMMAASNLTAGQATADATGGDVILASAGVGTLAVGPATAPASGGTVNLAAAATMAVSATTAAAQGEGVGLDAAGTMVLAAATAAAAGGAVAFGGQGALAVVSAAGTGAADGSFLAAASLALAAALAAASAAGDLTSGDVSPPLVTLVAPGSGLAVAAGASGLAVVAPRASLSVAGG